MPRGKSKKFRTTRRGGNSLTERVMFLVPDYRYSEKEACYRVNCTTPLFLLLERHLHRDDDYIPFLYGKELCKVYDATLEITTFINNYELEKDRKIEGIAHGLGAG